MNFILPPCSAAAAAIPTEYCDAADANSAYFGSNVFLSTTDLSVTAGVEVSLHWTDVNGPLNGLFHEWSNTADNKGMVDEFCVFYNSKNKIINSLGKFLTSWR